jgi:hypothetical protein
MKTERRELMEKRHKKFMEGKRMEIEVINLDNNAWVTSTFSELAELEHKIALDIMTNCYHGIENPIVIRVKVINDKEIKNA